MAEEVTWVIHTPTPGGLSPHRSWFWGGMAPVRRREGHQPCVSVPCAAPGLALHPWLRAGPCPGGARDAALEGDVQPGTAGVRALAPHPARPALTMILGLGVSQGDSELQRGEVTPTQHPGDVQAPSLGLQITGDQHKPILKGSGGD